MKLSIQELEIEIATTQATLKKLMPASEEERTGESQNSLIKELNEKLESLQKQYAQAREPNGGLQQIYERLTLDKSLPDIDQQIEYMRRLVNNLPGALVDENMPSAIYQSLIGARLLSQTNAPASDAETVIMELSLPYDLDACSRFIDKLRVRIGKPGNDAQRLLIRMYQALSENLYFAKWVAKVTADLLLSEPGNKEEKEAPPSSTVIDVAREGDRYRAIFKGSDDKLIGTGDTEQKAIEQLLEFREARKQAELFPVGGHAI